jgi:hypothetical protein
MLDSFGPTQPLFPINFFRNLRCGGAAAKMNVSDRAGEIRRLGAMRRLNYPAIAIPSLADEMQNERYQEQQDSQPYEAPPDQVRQLCGQD